MTLADCLRLPMGLAAGVPHTLMIDNEYTLHLQALMPSLIRAGLPLRPVGQNDRPTSYILDCLLAWQQQQRGDAYTLTLQPAAILDRDQDYDLSYYGLEDEPIPAHQAVLTFDLTGCDVYSAARMLDGLEAYPGSGAYNLGQMLVCALENLTDHSLPIGGPRYALDVLKAYRFYDEDEQFDHIQQQMEQEWCEKNGCEVPPGFTPQQVHLYILNNDIDTYRTCAHRLGLDPDAPRLWGEDALRGLSAALNRARRQGLSERQYEYALDVLERMRVLRKLDQEVQDTLDRDPHHSELGSYTMHSLRVPPYILDLASEAHLRERVGIVQEYISECEQLSMEYGDPNPPLVISSVGPDRAADALRLATLMRRIDTLLGELLNRITDWPLDAGENTPTRSLQCPA